MRERGGGPSENVITSAAASIKAPACEIKL